MLTERLLMNDQVAKQRILGLPLVTDNTAMEGTTTDRSE